MSNTIQVRRGGYVSLPTLNSGEFGFTTDSHRLFIGDGAVNHEILKTSDTAIVETGTANGQIAFWDTDTWKHTEISELRWDDTAKRLVLAGNPTADLHAAPKQYVDPLYAIPINIKSITGFVDNSAITVSYNWTNRTITLTGDLRYYWRGELKELTSPWTSSAHTATVGPWFLSTTDGTNFTLSQSVWTFDVIQVAYANYQSTELDSFALREVHGSELSAASHRSAHYNIGTYRFENDGGLATAGTYAYGTKTDAAITPGFNQGTIHDEDITSTVAALPEGTYTVMYVDASGNSVFDTTRTVPFLEAGSFIQVNDPSDGSLSNASSGKYYNVYDLMIPATADAGSQKYRHIFIVPQNGFSSLTDALDESVNSVDLGSLSSLSPEFVISARLTYKADASAGNTGKVTLEDISYIYGNTASRVTVGGATPSNHALLSNLSWGTSGHYGTPYNVPRFNALGLAADSVITALDDKVGIRQSTPLASLHVKQPNVSWGAGIRLENASNTNYWEFIQDGTNNLWLGYNSGGATLIVDPLNRRLGINLSSTPLAQLHINGGTGSLATGLAFGDGDTGIWESSDDKLRFSTASTTRMVITSGGNVLIGTSTDDTVNKLQVNGSGYFSDTINIGKDGWLLYKSGVSYVGIYHTAANVEWHSTSGHFWMSNNVAKMTLSTTGSLWLNDIPNAADTVENILVEDSGVIKYRTISSVIGDELDATYLRLDTTNDPLTGDLVIGIDGAAERNLRINSDIAGSYTEISNAGNVSYIRAWNNQNLQIDSRGAGGYITFVTNGIQAVKIDSNQNVQPQNNVYLFSGKRIYFDNGISNDYSMFKNGTALQFTTGGYHYFTGGTVVIEEKLQLNTVLDASEDAEILRRETNGNVTSSSISELIGDIGYWDRSGSTLTPATSTDNIKVNTYGWFKGSEDGDEAAVLKLGRQYSGENPLFTIITDDVSADSLTITTGRFGANYIWEASSAEIGAHPMVRFDNNYQIGVMVDVYGSALDNTVKVRLNSGGLSYFNGGDVVIGGTSANGLLDVRGGVLRSTHVDGASRAYISPSSSGTDFAIQDASASSVFRIDTRTGQEVAWYNDGNFLIGTSTDSGYKFHVKLPSNDVYVTDTFSDANGFRGIGIDGTNASLRLNGSGDIWHLTALSDSFRIFQTGSANQYRFLINQSGNISLGNTNNTYKLDVTGEIFTSSGIRINDGSFDRTALTKTSNYIPSGVAIISQVGSGGWGIKNGPSTDLSFWMTYGGNVQIGDTSADNGYKLYVNGTGYVSSHLYTAGIFTKLNGTSKAAFTVTNTPSATEEALVRISNGANWGLLIRGYSNYPHIGAWSSGAVNFTKFTDTDGTLGDTLMSVDFNNDNVWLDGSMLIGAQGTAAYTFDVRGTGRFTSHLILDSGNIYSGGTLNLYPSGGTVALQAATASVTVSTGHHLYLNETPDDASATASILRRESTGRVVESDISELIGDIGYWDRNGAILTTATANDSVSVQGYFEDNTALSYSKDTGVSASEYDWKDVDWKTGTSILDRKRIYTIRLWIGQDTSLETGAVYIVRDTANYATDPIALEIEKVSGDTNGRVEARIDPVNLDRIQVCHNYTGGTYRVKYRIESILTDNNNTTFHALGGDYMWKRTGDTLYHTAGSVAIGKESATKKLEIESASADHLSLTNTASGVWANFVVDTNDLTISASRNIVLDSSRQIMFDVASTTRYNMFYFGGTQYGQLGLDGSNLLLESTVSGTGMTFNTANGDFYFNTSNGNVGIGTASPDYEVDIESSSTSYDANIRLKQGAGPHNIIIGYDATSRLSFTATHNTGAGPVLFDLGDDVQFSDRIGIGVDPTSVIHTYTASENVGRFQSSDGTAYIQINDNADSLYVGTASQYGFFGGTASLNSANLVVDLTTGYLGLGTSTPNYRFHNNSVFTATNGVENANYMYMATSGVLGAGEDYSPTNVNIYTTNSITGSDDTDRVTLTGLNVATLNTSDYARYLHGIYSSVYTTNAASSNYTRAIRGLVFKQGTSTQTLSIPIDSYFQIEGVSGNVTTYRGVNAEAYSAGEGAVVSNSSLFYGVYGGTTSDFGSSRYGIYITGEVYNYLSGRLGIGTGSPLSDLEIIGSTGIRISDASNHRLIIQHSTDSILNHNHGANGIALQISGTNAIYVAQNKEVTLGNIPNATTTVDNILVEDSGIIKYRTVSDIIGNELEDLYVNVAGDTMTGNLTIRKDGGYADLTLASHNDTAGWAGSHIVLRRSRGSYASPNIVNSGDKLGWLDFYGYDGSNYIRAGELDLFVTGTPSTGIIESYYGFVTYNSSGIATTALYLSSTSASFAGTNISAGGNTVWHAGNDGTGSGLDADLLDGSELDDIVYGSYKGTFVNTVSDYTSLSVNRTGFFSSAAATDRPSASPNWTYLMNIRLYDSNNTYHKQMAFDAYTNDTYVRTNHGDWKKFWTEDNFDPTSGTTHTHSQYLRTDANDETNASIRTHFGGEIVTSSARIQVNGFQRTGTVILHAHDGDSTSNSVLAGVNKELAYHSVNGLTWGAYTIWHAGNDGDGSGLDADLIKGKNFYADYYYGGDVNLINAAGFYFANSSSTNKPSNGVLLHGRYNGTDSYSSQLLISHMSNTMYFRSADAGTWETWKEVWHDGNFDPSDGTTHTHSQYVLKAGDTMTGNLNMTTADININSVNYGLTFENEVNALYGLSGYTLGYYRNIDRSGNAIVGSPYKAAKMTVDNSGWKYFISNTVQTAGVAVAGLNEVFHITELGNFDFKSGTATFGSNVYINSGGSYFSVKYNSTDGETRIFGWGQDFSRSSVYIRPITQGGGIYHLGNSSQGTNDWASVKVYTDGSDDFLWNDEVVATQTWSAGEYVPYTGATSDVDLGAHTLRADTLEIERTATSANALLYFYTGSNIEYWIGTPSWGGNGGTNFYLFNDTGAISTATFYVDAALNRTVFSETPYVSANQIWHAGNSNLSTVDWTVNSLYADNTISLDNGTVGALITGDATRAYLVLDSDSSDGIGVGADYLYIARNGADAIINNSGTAGAMYFQIHAVEQGSFTSSGFGLRYGARVDNIETTLTNDDTNIPTSQAVYNAIQQTALGYVNYTGTPVNNQIAVFTDVNTIEGDAGFTWDGTILSADGSIRSIIYQSAGNTGFIGMESASSSMMIPMLFANSESTDDGLYFLSEPDDISQTGFTGAAFFFNARTNSNFPLTSGNLLQITNDGAVKYQIDYSGNHDFKSGTATFGNGVYISPSTDNSVLTLVSQTGGALIYLNSGEDGLGTDNSILIYQDNGTSKWYAGKNSNNSFVVYNYTTAANALSISSSNNAVFAGSLASNVIANATTDTDKFLVSDGGTIKYRTGAEVLSDIGGSASGHTHDDRYYTETESDAKYLLNTTDTFTGTLTVDNAVSTAKISFIDLKRGTGNYLKLQTDSDGAGNVTVLNFRRSTDNADILSLSYSAGIATFIGAVNAPNFVSTVATGTAPLTVASTTLVTNLNADLLDGHHWSDITGGYVPYSGATQNVNLGTYSLFLYDNAKFTVGTGGDATFFHDGSHSYLDNDTGSFYMRNDGTGSIIIRNSVLGNIEIDNEASGGIYLSTSNVYRYVVDSSGNHDFKSGTATFGGSIYMDNTNIIYQKDDGGTYRINLWRTTNNELTQYAGDYVYSWSIRDEAGTRKLWLDSSGNFTSAGIITGTDVITGGLRVTDNASNGYIAVSDASGNLIWTAPSSVNNHTHSQYLRNDTDNSVSSYAYQVTFPSNSTMETATSDQASLEVYNTTANNDAFMQFHISGDYAVYFGLDGTTNDLAVGGFSMGAVKHKVWHAGNSNKSDVNWKANQLTVSNDSNSAAPLTLIRSSQVGIYFYDTSAPRYLGSSGGNLYFGTALDHSTNNLVWHAGNSNLKSVDWNTYNIHMAQNAFITFYGTDDAKHGIGSRSTTGTASDDIRVNTFGSFIVNLDSNNNQTSSADFIIGKHGSSTGALADTIFTIDGETGTVTHTAATDPTHSALLSQVTSAVSIPNDQIAFGNATGTGLDSSSALTFNGTIFKIDGARPISLREDWGAIQIKGNTGGWDIGTFFYGSSDTAYGGFGAYGNIDSIYYYYIGTSYNSATNFRIYTDGSIRASEIESYVATGTAPLTVASTTLVSNLNADLLDGHHASYFSVDGHTHSQYLLNTTDTLTGNLTVTGEIDVPELTSTFWIYTPALRVTTLAGSGKIAVSDADGDLVWTSPGSVTGIDYGNLINTPSIPTVNNATITIGAGTGLTTGGDFTTNQAGNETITINHSTADGYKHIPSGGSLNQILVNSASGTAVWTDAPSIVDLGGVPTLRTITLDVADNTGHDPITISSSDGVGGVSPISQSLAGDRTWYIGHATFSQPDTNDGTLGESDTVITSFSTDGHGHINGYNYGSLPASYNFFTLQAKNSSGTSLGTDNITSEDSAIFKAGTNVTLSMTGNEITINASGGATVSNYGATRLITSGASASALNAESSLTFDTNVLTVNGTTAAGGAVAVLKNTSTFGAGMYLGELTFMESSFEYASVFARARVEDSSGELYIKTGTNTNMMMDRYGDILIDGTGVSNGDIAYSTLNVRGSQAWQSTYEAAAGGTLGDNLTHYLKPTNDRDSWDLPAFTQDRIYIITNIDTSNGLEITPDGSDLINGSGAALTVSAGEVWLIQAVVSANSNWLALKLA